MAALLAADQMPVFTHAFVYVFVADIGLFVIDADAVEGFIKAEVAHDGRNDGVIGELVAVLHVFAVDVEYQVAVDDAAFLVHGDAAVRVAVEGEANV